MKRYDIRSYLILVLFIFIVLSAPKRLVFPLRFFTIQSILPINSCLASIFSVKKNVIPKEELEKVKAENFALKQQASQLKQLLIAQQSKKDLIDESLYLSKLHTSNEDYKQFLKRRVEQLQNRIAFANYLAVAKIIYRDPNHWSSEAWIDKGENENKALGRQIIQKNSPVIVGDSLVGIVEEVYKNKSKIRFISDEKLSPAVRALRGDAQKQYFVQQIQSLIHCLQGIGETEQYDQIADCLKNLKQVLSEGPKQENAYLAKGIVHGFSEPLWRCRSVKIKGEGFNYDFSDAEGSSKELMNEMHAILEVGDILITSGMDGLFPEGLKVGIVTKISSLKEGSFAYDLQAYPTAGNLHNLTNVQILPAII